MQPALPVRFINQPPKPPQCIARILQLLKLGAAIWARVDHVLQVRAHCCLEGSHLRLRRLNGLLGFENQTFTEDVYLTIRKLKRAKSTEQRQAAGINEGLLAKMIEAQPDTLVGKRNRLLLSLCYDFLARRSELVAIRSEDLTLTPDGALKGIIRHSKTDQYGRGRLVFGSERGAKLLKKWLRLKPKEIQPVFCAMNHGCCLDCAICDRQVNEIHQARPGQGEAVNTAD